MGERRHWSILDFLAYRHMEQKEVVVMNELELLDETINKAFDEFVESLQEEDDDRYCRNQPEEGYKLH